MMQRVGNLAVRSALTMVGLAGAVPTSRSALQGQLRFKAKAASKGLNRTYNYSPGKRLGLKTPQGTLVDEQHVLVRQRFEHYVAGENTYYGWDYTLLAARAGVVLMSRVDTPTEEKWMLQVHPNWQAYQKEAKRREKLRQVGRLPPEHSGPIT
eukprot:RCo026175